MSKPADPPKPAPPQPAPARAGGASDPVTALAAAIFAQTYSAARGRTAESVARDALTAAREFYRAASEPAG